MRDEAFAVARPAHDRIRQELAIFKNKGYYGREHERVGTPVVQVNESLMPQITTGILRLHSAFREQMSEIKIEPDTHEPDTFDILMTEGLSQWNQMYEEVYNEGGQMRINIHRNLAVGNTINKTRYDPHRKLVCSEPINPVNFAPDPDACQANFSDAMYVCQKTWQTREYLLSRYEDWRPTTGSSAPTTLFRKGQHKEVPAHRVDEIWMTREKAEMCGINVSKTTRQIILAVLIDNEIYDIKGSPYWHPEFPYTFWRNFIDLNDNGNSHNFWGYGYGTLCWSQQKMIDEFIANFIRILRNLSVGRILSVDGAIDEDYLSNRDGANIRINENFTLNDVREWDPQTVPPQIMEFVLFMSQTMQDLMPSLSPVFAGDAPSGSSGRAISHLQFANFSQLSDNIREMNEFRKRTKRIRLSLIQQFAKEPMHPNLWRGGLDLKGPFPEDARHIGYRLSTPDLTQLPNTPQGKLAYLNHLTQLGYIPKDPLNLLGITQGYGWTSEDFEYINPMLMAQMQGQGMDFDAASGFDPTMPIER